MILLELFWTFFKIGLFTFGGGYSMLPMIQSEVVSHGWISEKALVDFIAVAESTPGPFAVNLSTYVGIEKAGLLGAVCALLGVILPSFIIILIVAIFYKKFRESKAVMGVMSGLKPCTVGLIAAAVLTMVGTVFWPDGFTTGIFTGQAFWISFVIFAGMVVCAFKKVKTPVIIGISAVLGIAVGYIFNLQL